jgi:3-oxoacyl-[acyl-carrier protein] reductase
MKYALVTGGSRGIGRAVCLKLAEQGYSILINYKNNEAEAQKTLQLVKEKGTDGELLRFDVSDKRSVDDVLGAWLENNKEKVIEVLVNNAGIRQDSLMIWMTDEQWKSVLGSSLDGFYYVTRLVINGMLTKRYGRIVNIVSLSGLKGMPGQTNYSAAKAGVIGATKALAQEVARRGVTVNAVAPGFIRTDMTQDLKEADLKSLIPMQPKKWRTRSFFLLQQRRLTSPGTCCRSMGDFIRKDKECGNHQFSLV